MNRPSRHHSYFFLRLSPAAALAVEHLRDEAEYPPNAVTAGRLHATIGKIGRFDEAPSGLIALLIDLLAGCSLPSCPMALDRIAGNTERHAAAAQWTAGRF